MRKELKTIRFVDIKNRFDFKSLKCKKDINRNPIYGKVSDIKVFEKTILHILELIDTSFSVSFSDIPKSFVFVSSLSDILLM